MCYLIRKVAALLISVAKRYNVKGKTYFNYPNKYYYTDIGLCNARMSYWQYNTSHITENLICSKTGIFHCYLIDLLFRRVELF